MEIVFKAMLKFIDSRFHWELPRNLYTLQYSSGRLDHRMISANIFFAMQLSIAINNWKDEVDDEVFAMIRKVNLEVVGK
jgi:hypothetical protein